MALLMNFEEEKIKRLAEFKKNLTLLIDENHPYIYQIDEIYVGANIIGKAIEDYITKHEKVYTEEDMKKAFYAGLLTDRFNMQYNTLWEEWIKKLEKSVI
jgi:hypothetical protein